MDDDFWTAVSYVEMSENRTKVLELLSESDKPLTPTEVSDELDIALNSASRALRQLNEKKLVECINPDAPRYRRYKPAKLGEKIAEEL
jgi:predicted transcriptional regulator